VSALCEFEYFLKKDRKAEVNFPLDSFDFNLVDLILDQILSLHVLERFFYFLVVHVRLVDFFVHVLDVWLNLTYHGFGATFKKTLEVLIFN
jgi:hypothetical protein